MRRREVLTGLALAGALGPAAAAQAQQAAGAPTSWDLARSRAQRLAAAAYIAPAPLPPQFPYLGYDAYRDINYLADKALWRDLGLPFQVQMFHRGGLFRDPVEVFEVADATVTPILYSPDLFRFGRQTLPVLPGDFGFAGLRIHTQMGVPGRFDELVAFVGASYFRAVSPTTGYGLSSRGLSLGSGDPNEEFPTFRAYYLERPAADATSVAICALLDSPSTSGAFRFVMTPGANTRIDVTASLFPRVALDAAGIAPLTSMYLFGAEQPRRFDDFRPQVHDSDGLLMADNQGQWSWRPLANPEREQISDYAGKSASGFGLLQRQRRFETYQDLEARYHSRPGCWVEPVAGFDRGAVRLVELTARIEGEDNIVASWRPGDPLAAGVEHAFTYRMTWGADPAPEPATVAKVVQWSDGRGQPLGHRRFVVDFSPTESISLESLRPDVSATVGSIQHINLQPNAYLGGARLSFEFDGGTAGTADLRAALVQDGVRVSEEWVHRWLS